MTDYKIVALAQQTVIDVLKLRIEQLERQLAQYGQHHSDCEKIAYPSAWHCRCTCGFEEVKFEIKNNS